MKKFLFFLSFAFLLILILPGCNLNQSNNNKQANQPPQNQQIPEPQKTETTVSFLISTQDWLKYCNGADMDSEGFRKTITKTITITIPEINLSREELIRQTIIAASQQANLETAISIDQNFLKIVGDTAYIRPIEGWAGVSIFLCAWKPLVEVNLLRFPEIKKIEWLNDPAKWAEINK